MSQTPHNSDLVNIRVVSEEEYQANLKRAEEAQAQLDHFKALNEAAKKAYDKQQELVRKIQEGKEAERQLQALSGGSEPGPLALAGPSTQANSSTSNQRWWYPSHGFSPQTYGPSHYGVQKANQPSGRQSIQQDKLKSVQEYPSVQQPFQSGRSQKDAQPQENHVSRFSGTTPTFVNHRSVQQGRQALPMQPVGSTLQSNQVQAVPQPPRPTSAPARPSSTSLQQGGQSYSHAQSGRGAAVPNFVTPFVAQQYKAPPPSESSLGGALGTTTTSQPPLSTAAQLPKATNSQDETNLGATAAKLQAHLDKRTLSQSDRVPVSSSAGGSNPQIILPANAVDLSSWQRFSRTITRWASTAPALSEMPLTNTRVRVWKDANYETLISLPGVDDFSPTTITLQGLLNSLQGRDGTVSTSNQGVPEPSNTRNAPDTNHGYRPYSVPQHQASQASARSDALSASTNIPERSEAIRSTTTPASTAPTSTPVKSSVAPPSSGRTPGQADKKSLAKDILRALSFPSLKRPRADEASVMETVEPPAKRHASGPTPGASDVIPQASMKIIKQYPQTTDISSSEAVSSGQAPSTSVPKTSTDVSTPEPILQKTSNSHSNVSTTAPNASQLSFSSIQTVSLAPSPQRLPQKELSSDNDLPVVGKNLFPERPKTPLFLPSPSSSPVAGPSGSIPDISSDLNHGAVQSTRKGVRLSHILVPPDPLWLQQYKAQQLRKKVDGGSERELESGDAKGSEDGSMGVHDGEQSIENEEIDVIDLDPANDLATDEFEREAILLSCSRIRERPCKWNGCSAILNSTEKLIQHLAYAHKEIFEGYPVCRWQYCEQSVVNWAKLFQHLKGHALIPLQCAYQDCVETFRTPRQLAKHHRAEHSNDPLKPSATPLAPMLRTPPDASPLILPSYLMDPIQRPSMTKERHGNLGPWVLQQIAGPVNHELKRYNAASKLLQSPSRSDKSGYQPYDFINFPSTNYSSAPSMPSKVRGMEDLLSGEVSDMVHHGLVLWGPQKEDESEDERFLSPSGPMLETHPNAKVVAEEQSDVDAVQSMLED